MKLPFVLFMLCVACAGRAQVPASNYKKTKVAVRDTVQLDSVSIQQKDFRVYGTNGKEVDTAHYTVDFKKARIYFNRAATRLDTVTVAYLKYPGFLTREYFT
ncbi:MAG: hypothetical protein ACPGU0_08095, partial [Marinirhabdus sp.]